MKKNHQAASNNRPRRKRRAQVRVIIRIAAWQPGDVKLMSGSIQSINP
jgi:hypothetical protein